MVPDQADSVDLIRRAGRAVVWGTLATTCGVVACGFFAADVSAAFAIGTLAFFALALYRVESALLVVAAVAPIASATHALLGLPYRSTAVLELAVFLVLAAAALRAMVRGTPIVTSRFDAAVGCFALIAAGSAVAQIPFVLRAARAFDGSERLWTYAVREYFLYPSPFVAFEQTAMLVAGAGFAAITARVVRCPAAGERMSNMLVLGGVAAAAMNAYRLFEIAFRRPPLSEGLAEALLVVRFNTQFPDLNAAGSYFAMIFLLAVCRANARTPAGWAHAAALPLLLLALWVSGSRVALAAALCCTLAVFIWRRLNGVALPTLRRSSIAAGAIALVAALVLVVYLLPATRHGDFAFSVSTRLRLLAVGARMWKDQPVFGVGTSQFYARFPEYTSPELQRAFERANGHPVTHENAHNQFLQFAAELGAVGLVAFLLVLWSALTLSSALTWQVSAAAALSAFLITCLAGHPLLMPLVAYPFWMMVGVTAGGQRASPGELAALRRGVLVVIIALVATMPLRWGA